MYINGQGLSQNYPEAYKWFKLAAEQGEGIAQTNLGLMYTKGQGVSQDHKQAVHWYRLAANQSIPSAQVKLGMMYEYGRGILQDYVLAYMWYSLGSSHGNKIAIEHCGIIEKKMTHSQRDKAQQLTREWPEKDRG
jgi:TPR repeat protein